MVRRVAACLSLLAALTTCRADIRHDQVLVAVAANFRPTMAELEADFERRTSYDVTVSVGATGQLYAQIRHGAPFDVFLAADEHRPALLYREGVASSPVTYAVGRLALWSPETGRLEPDGPAALAAADWRRLAIANPDVAPYGAAAVQVIEALALSDHVADKLATAESVGQAYAWTAMGAADLGFVALAQLRDPGAPPRGAHWEPPVELYTPIRQDAVVLARAGDNPAATAFLAYLQSDPARAIIARYGYGFEDDA